MHIKSILTGPPVLQGQLGGIDSLLLAKEKGLEKKLSLGKLLLPHICYTECAFPFSCKKQLYIVLQMSRYIFEKC